MQTIKQRFANNTVIANYVLLHTKSGIRFKAEVLSLF